MSKPRYVLRYEDSYVSEIIMPSDVDVDSMREYLEYFLLSASWPKSLVDEILGIESSAEEPSDVP